MKKYIKYNEDEIENLFIELLHVNELDIKFNFIEYDVHIYYFYNDMYVFEYDKTFERICMNNKITNVIDKWEITSLPKYTFIEKLMKKYFDLSYKSLFNDSKDMCDDIENDFNI